MILTKANISELKKVTVKILCPNEGEGSGTVVCLDGVYYVLTAAHVIENDTDGDHWDIERISIAMTRNSTPCNFKVDEVVKYDRNGYDVAIIRVTYTGKMSLSGLDRVRLLSSNVNGVASFCGFHKGDSNLKHYSFENRGEATWAIANVNLSTQPLPPVANFEGTSGGGIFYQDDEKNLYMVAYMSSLGRYDGVNNEFDCLPATNFNITHLFDAIIDSREYEYSQDDSEVSRINRERSLKELDHSDYDKNQKDFFMENEKTDDVLTKLRDDGEMTIVMTALSGMGKSKLIYEAFKKTEKFENRYYAKYDDDRKKILQETEQILLKNYDKDGIIIVDDWPVEYISELIRARDNHRSQFRLIMVNHDYFNEQLREDSLDYTLIKISPNDMEERVGRYISQELKENDRNEADVTAIKQMAGGYPQMAIELVRVYKSQHSVGPDAVSHLMPKLLSLTPGSEKEETAIWQTLSLCLPFPYKNASHEGFEFMMREKLITPLSGIEYEQRRSIAAKIIEKYNPTLVDIQGMWLYVRPFPLAVWLTAEWFKNVCNTQAHFNELIECIKTQPEWVQNSISEGFCKHIQQMSGNKVAFNMVEKLVNADVNHPFFNEEILRSGLGSKLFLAMSTVNPAAIASSLKAVLGNKDIIWLKENLDGDGRRNVVWALERLCFAAESFNDGVLILAKLAAAENENYSNNASGQLVQLFRISLAGTEVNLKERLKALQTLIREGEENPHLIVRCFDAAFRNGGYTKMAGAEKFGFENRKDYSPRGWDEVYEYWLGCRDLLISWMDEKPSIVGLVAGLVENNVYSWASSGQKDLLVSLMTKIAELKEYHWDSGYEALAKTVYTFGVNANLLGVEELMTRLKNNSFKTKINEARYIINGKYNLGDKEQFELSQQLFSPLVNDFFHQKVYLNDEEVRSLLEDIEYISIDFVKPLAIKATDEQLRNLLNTVLRVLKTKPKEFYSPFLGNFTSYIGGRIPMGEFLDELRNMGRESLYISLMAGTEDNGLGHFQQLFSEQRNGLLKMDFLPVYLRFFRSYGEDRYLQVLKALRDYFPERPNDLVSYVETERFMMRKDDNPESVKIVKDALLSFKIDGDSGRMLNEYSRILIETLQQWHDIDFAKKVNKKMIDVYNTQMVHISMEGIFTELLKDYFDDVWLDFVTAFLGEDTFLFYYQVKGELGSGFGLGKGPLFNLNDDLIKQLCIDNPKSAPVRIAAMAPLFDQSKDGTETEHFSKWVLWLLDNFGEQKDVRSSISSNLGSFTWTGNLSPYYERNIKCFEKLLNHHILEVRDWAQKSIIDEKKLLDMEKDNEDFMRIRYGI